MKHVSIRCAFILRKIGSGSGKWVFLNHLDFFIYQSILFILRDHTYYMVNSYHAKGNRNKICFDMTKKLKNHFFQKTYFTLVFTIGNAEVF